MSLYDDVKTFRRKFDHPTPDRPTEMPMEWREYYVAHLYEEVDELRAAFVADDLAEQADAIVDLIYVAIGGAVIMGLPFERLWEEVHRTNMAKEPGEGRRGFGRDVIKPDGWIPPDLRAIIAQALR